jgi:hypothetical protein
MMSVLEDHADDPVVAELRGFVVALTEDEQVDLAALAWLGRGDGTLEDWGGARRGSRSPPQQAYDLVSARIPLSSRHPWKRVL